MTANNTLYLAQALIARRSLTPDDAGCQEVLIERLERLGFAVERMRFGHVDNFWARRGTTGPVVCFAGHTDVVPTGPLAQWASDPFTPTVRDGQNVLARERRKVGHRRTQPRVLEPDPRHRLLDLHGS